MTFNDPEQVSSVCWQMRQADYSRGSDRARINRLFNGQPPYYADEAEESGIEINVNFLESTVLGHDARQQITQALLKPGNFFQCTTDAGPVHKRRERSVVATNEAGRLMKRSLKHHELMRSKIAGYVLHGIGPAVWQDRDRWCSKAIGIEDLLIPSDMSLDFDELPLFCILRTFTAAQLTRLAEKTKVDKGWNQPLLKKLRVWIDQETMNLLGTTFPDIWSPEKTEERIKGDGGFYAGDQVPKISVFDFWYYSDENDHCGWRRRMILDDWTPPGAGGAWSRNNSLGFSRNEWLYNSGSRVYADSHQQIFSCQFADLSAVPPFRYHSVRSLGQLVYAICHLQNRMRCRFSEAVFENLMMYFRVKGDDDTQRASKINLVNRGFIPQSVDFLDPASRWNINTQLAELGLQENASLIARHASSYTTSMVQQATDKREKTKFEVMAETASASQLVGAALQQVYSYQTFEYRENFRRLTRENSIDPEVLTFQARCKRQGVPDSILFNPEAWDIEAERVMGGGNKAMEMAIAQQLLSMRNLYDPEPQRQILRDVTLAVTDDAARAKALVPDAPQVSDSVHDAQLRFGSLMAGGEVKPKSGVNHVEVVETLLAGMEREVQRIQQTGGVPESGKEIMGLANVALHVAQEIQMLAQDPGEKARVKQYGDKMGQLMNEVKAFAQRYAEQKQQQNGGAQGDPELMGKIQAMIIQAQAKAANTRESHAQRTAQRQIAFEMEQERKGREFDQEMQREVTRQGQELAGNRLKTEQDVNNAAKPKPESKS